MDTEDVKFAVHRLWLILKCRPLMTCPLCSGKGGHMSGYYEPEWDECPCCWQHWEPMDDAGMEWPDGRLPFLPWLRAKVALACGVDPRERIRHALACKIGWHDWEIDDYPDEPGHQTCNVCYTTRTLEPENA